MSQKLEEAVEELEVIRSVTRDENIQRLARNAAIDIKTIISKQDRK